MRTSPEKMKVHLLLACLCTATSMAAFGQGNYASFELRRDENWDPIVLEDMNGDGRKDIISSAYDAALGRELHIYHQQDDGTFSSNPQRIEVKTEIIAIGFADLRPTPGTELILFANNGVFSLSSTIEGYPGNLKLLAQWQLIAAIPDLERVRFTNIPTDINGDGHIDLLLAGDDRYGLFLGQGNEEFVLASEIRTLNDAITPLERARNNSDLDATLGINAERGVVIELNLEAPGPFQGFVEEWDQADTTSRSLLRAEQWMPTAVLASMNDDELPDLVYLNAGDQGLGRVNIHYQGQESLFAESADWTGDLDSRGQLELVDLNGDGRDDILQQSGNGSDWTVRLYLNTGEGFDFQNPSQLLRFSGYDLQLNALTDNTGSPLLSASYYTIPVVEAIRNASINRVQLLFGSDQAEAGQVYNRRPDSRLEESFSADNVRGLSEQMSLRYDVDGDGTRDALYVTANGTLAARRISDDLQIANEPFWEYVSPRTVFEFEVMSLNYDQVPDLMLRHGTSTTFLVALP